MKAVMRAITRGYSSSEASTMAIDAINDVRKQSQKPRPSVETSPRRIQQSEAGSVQKSFSKMIRKVIV